jgi:K319-like protein
VTFQDPNAVDTQASFVLAGTYVLRLTASDGALSASDSMTVTVRINTAPVVDAGPNLNVALPFDVLLDATVTDDGLPSPPAAVTVTWSVASGPGTVTFLNANAVDTRASFGQAGTYVLRLTASDGALPTVGSTTVTVQPAPPPGSSAVERRVAASTDDAEETLRNGSMRLSSANLQIIHRSKNDQIVGIRFTGLMIPRGVAITKAWIQFTATAIQTTTTSLQLRAQAAGSPPTFSSASANISSRPKTAASIGWTPPAWNVIGEAGSGQRTSDITSVIQEIVNRSDWTHGNALVILITGTGTRTAAAFDGAPASAALLHVEY